MIALGSDHGGFLLKEEIKKYLDDQKIEYKDFGVFDEKAYDYPDIAKVTCSSVVSGECNLGILVCGTGVGIGIAANKIKGIRACVCSEVYSARMSRLHNDANVLALGGRVIGVETAKDIVDAFLNASFLGGRHEKRVDKIIKLEN